MCEAPGRLNDGQEIPCRKCWQCLERRVDDWTGRCIAETRTCAAAHSITLTYGRDENGNSDHMRAAVLTYSDVQKFFKLLRRHGYQFRYLVAGEYGATKGRAHWHLLMFWKDKVPPHEISTPGLARRFENKYWPHGFQHWEIPGHGATAAVRYVVKYLNKGVAKDERQAHFSMSKKPPIGQVWFRARAEQYVAQGLSPQSYEYAFPDIRRDDGTAKKFYMTGATAHDFVEHYKKTWAEQRGGWHPYSKLIEDHDDAIARRDYIPARDNWGARKPNPPEYGTEPMIGTRNGVQLLYSDAFGYRYWYERTDGEEGGEWQWRRREEIEDAWRKARRAEQYRRQSTGDL